MSNLRLGHLELFVSDPDASMRFYRDVLGFEVIDVQQDRFVWLASGGREVLLRPAASGAMLRPTDYARSGLAFVLYADDLDAVVARLAAAGLEPAGTDGSPRCPTYRDPDGHWFQVVDPGSH